MNLGDLVHRRMAPKPWQEGEKIPWNDPDFSRRMLREHLTQEHDAASRRTSRIKRHVDWIHQVILAGRPSRLLDLGCGPGLYASRLAALGHTCHGIDFSPASIEYAKEHANAGCTYTLADIRTAEFGEGYELAMFIYGELNVFRKQHCRKIVKKIWKALERGGKLLIEIQSFDAVEQLGNQPPTWYASPRGLFSDRPHLVLMESFWDEARSVATERFFVVDVRTGEVSRFAASTQAYDDEAIASLLAGTGFGKIRFHASLTGEAEALAEGFKVIVAEK